MSEPVRPQRDIRDSAAAATHADAVQLHFAEALARRAAGCQGAVRELLEHRLASLPAARGELAPDPARAADDVPPQTLRPGPLGELVRHLDQRAKTGNTGPLPRPAQASAVPADLAYFRRIWSRLSADQRLAQSLSTLPENAGPLNSHQLVHRALSLMRELSPEYLDRFVGYVDTLLWLEPNHAGAIDAKAAAKPEQARKPRRAKP